MNNQAVKLLQERRSIRTFDPGRQLSEEHLQAIVKVALNTPTARNLQRFHITVVQDQALLEHMAELIRQQMLLGDEGQRQKASVPGYSPLHHAPTLIVVTGELKASFHVQTDCGIAIGMICAAAEELGVSSCITGSSLFMFQSAEGDELKKKLKIPDNHQTVCTIALGYMKGEKPLPPERKSDDELLDYVR